MTPAPRTATFIVSSTQYPDRRRAASAEADQGFSARDTRWQSVRLSCPRRVFGDLEDRDGLDAIVPGLVGDRLPLGKAEERRAHGRQQRDVVGIVPVFAGKRQRQAIGL